MVDVLNLCTPALGQIQETPYFGTFVAPAPSSFSDPVYVLIPEIDPLQPWPAINTWPQSHGTTLPAVGGSCMLAFDNRRNLWLVAW